MSMRHQFYCPIVTSLWTWFVISALACPHISHAQESREMQWKSVREAIEQGLPKTAIERLDPIIAQAQAAQDFDATIKAVCMKISLEGEIEGNLPEEKITRLRSEIEKSPEPMRPVMEAILANWFWQYFQQNRWQFLQRTQTSTTPGDDFKTWDLTRILSEVDRHFQQALASDDLLKSIPVDQYVELLDKGSVDNTHRPTLYDILANNAIEFYSAGEQAAAKIEDSFDLSASGPIFGDASEFVSWNPETNDEDALLLRAIRLYQSLLRFHQKDVDQTAFLDSDLSRLNFGNNHAFGEEKVVRYRAALRRFADTNADHPIAALALHQLAVSLRESEDQVASHATATEGLKRHPDTIGGRRCYNLIQEIEAPSVSITAERVWNGFDSSKGIAPTVDVTYRNVTKVFFRLVPFDFQRFLTGEQWSPEQLDAAERSRLFALNSIATWSAELPRTDDYKDRVETVAVPKVDKSGSYYLIASHNEKFDPANNQISISEIWVSDLALVTRDHGGKGVIDGFVLRAVSGEPVAGANVDVWSRDSRSGKRQSIQSIKTDANGVFRIAGSDQRQLILLASHQGQSLSSANHLNLYRYQRAAPTVEQTIFFTDRSIYRPGQTIQFKGICLSVDQNANRYQVVARKSVTVAFTDVNGKQIEQLTLRTNDYGSFSGSVTAPRDRLMGRMQLAVVGKPAGQTQVTVEEYKRPKFRVELKSPTDEIKLGKEVTVVGEATAYTGASIDDAGVTWRVVRKVRYPQWWLRSCWWMPPQPDTAQEIAHGVAKTDAAGRFQVAFVAKPDLSVSVDSEPIFEFEVHADITDGAGETRSDQRSVRIGYTALAASMTSSEWLTNEKPTEISIRTLSLDGENRVASGTVKIHRLTPPKTVSRSKLSTQYRRFDIRDKPDPDLSNPDSWPTGEVAVEKDFATDASGSTSLTVELQAGLYRAVLETTDAFGKAVKAELPLRVLQPDANKFTLKLPFVLASPQSSVQPGEQYMALWGSGYESARAYIEVEQQGKVSQSYWTKPDVTQSQIRQAVNETMRGGFTIRVTMVKENRAYFESRVVDVPWTNKQLDVRWEHFVSKLQPGAKETWTAIVHGPDAGPAVAEMVAGLYDSSLDAFLPHSWQQRFNVFRREQPTISSTFQNQAKFLQAIINDWNVDQRDASLTYPRLADEIMASAFGGHFGGGFGVKHRGMMMKGGVDLYFAEPMANSMMLDAAAPAGAAEHESDKNEPPTSDSKPTIDFDNISMRTNLNETAFFFPNLIAGKDGSVRMEFTMPEALTQWKFLSFAHDRELRSGSLTDSVVTAKDLMVQPNPPRFVREGDEIEFTVKVVNQSPTRQTGTLRLTFADARTGKSVDAQLENDAVDKNFEVPAGQSESLAWRINVADGLGVLTYKAVGSTGRLSDGEEGLLPVLSRRVLVTESITLPIRGKQTKQFTFEKLLRSGESESLEHQSVTAQMVSNPSWYAVMALPYLMEYPHQCSEQTFNRLYANSIARYIASSDPKIQKVFAQWRATPALESPLEKNQDIKSVVLEETPWVRQADAESQARRNVGVLFDKNRLDSETKRAFDQLVQMQLDDGTWPWFPGGRSNEYITLYIMTGFGRMRHLGVDVDVTAAVRSLNRLDAWMTEQYSQIKDADRSKNHLSTTIALYLYGRSFFKDDHAVAPEHRIAFDYWVGQATSNWLSLGHRQSQAHIAVALNRLADATTARAIMESIKERSVSNEELGMFWRDTERSWWWYQAPIESQAMMIEAFDEVMDDAVAVEDCKVWLLKQKQTQEWQTTKSTADAIYALLLRGKNVLASDELVKISLGGKLLEPSKVEAGTGFFEERFVGGNVTASLGEITVTKVDDGVAWGSVHWQYLEDMSMVTPHVGTPLTLTKQLYVKKNTAKGPMLTAVDGVVAVGDELVVRIVLKSDRDMEYLHLKDYRGSGTEPVNVLSRYQFQDGLAYYESTRDTACHFFIDYLPKGTYVFEYSTRVQLRGAYQTGYANIQCMYAPEFGGHSESLPIIVE